MTHDEMDEMLDLLEARPVRRIQYRGITWADPPTNDPAEEPDGAQQIRGSDDP